MRRLITDKDINKIKELEKKVQTDSNDATIVNGENGVVINSAPEEPGAQIIVNQDPDAAITFNSYIEELDDLEPVVEIFNGLIRMAYLPTSDPQVMGVLWNDNGVLKVSAGD